MISISGISATITFNIREMNLMLTALDMYKKKCLDVIENKHISPPVMRILNLEKAIELEKHICERWIAAGQIISERMKELMQKLDDESK